MLALPLSNCSDDQKELATPPSEIDTNEPNKSEEYHDGSINSENKKDALCLSSCSTPEGAAYSFSDKAVQLAPAECSVDDAQIFDSTNGLTMIYSADCNSNYQLYMRRISYDGLFASEPLLLSRICLDNFFEVKMMNAAMGNRGIVTSFTCNTNNSSTYQTYSVLIDEYYNALAAQLIESFDIGYSQLQQDYNYKLAWNEVAESFGLARRGAFFRLDSKGGLMGGRTSIANEHHYHLSKLFVVNGKWILLQSDPYKRNNSYSYCSKVNSLGQAECNSKTLDLSNALLLSDERFLNWDSLGNLNQAPFNPDLCESGSPSLIGEVNEHNFDNVFSTIDINADYTGVLYLSGNDTLNLALILRSSPMSLASVVPVATQGDVSRAQALLVRGHLMTVFIQGEQVWLKISDQIVR